MSIRAFSNAFCPICSEVTLHHQQRCIHCDAAPAPKPSAPLEAFHHATLRSLNSVRAMTPAERKARSRALKARRLQRYALISAMDLEAVV